MKAAAWRHVECTKCGSPPGKRCRRRGPMGEWIPGTNPHAVRVDVGKATVGDRRKKDVREFRAANKQYFVRMVI